MFYIAFALFSIVIATLVVNPIFIEYCKQMELEEGSIEAKSAYGITVVYKASHYFLMFVGIMHLIKELH